MEGHWDPGDPLRDLSPGRWIEERLWAWGDGSGRDGVPIGCLLPEGFEAYARLLHPARRQKGSDLEPVRWSQMASRTGRTAHPLMQFPRIANLPLNEFPDWDMPPSEGEIPAAEAERLVANLRPFTSTPDRCYLALWEGFGVPELRAFDAFPRLRVPHRAYFVFLGPIDAVATLTLGDFHQRPNLWWPEDRAWCVATDIDLFETDIAGTDACIQRLLADPDLEIYRVAVDARIDIDGDVINA